MLLGRREHDAGRLHAGLLRSRRQRRHLPTCEGQQLTAARGQQHRIGVRSVLLLAVEQRRAAGAEAKAGAGEAAALAERTAAARAIVVHARRGADASGDAGGEASRPSCYLPARSCGGHSQQRPADTAAAEGVRPARWEPTAAAAGEKPLLLLLLL